MDFNKKLVSLPPEEFEKYFDSFPFEAHGLNKKDHDWKKEYKKIGGKIGTRSTGKESPED